MSIPNAEDSQIVQNLRRAGLGHWVDAAKEGVETLCTVAGYEKVSQTGQSMALVPRESTGRLLTTTTSTRVDPPSTTQQPAATDPGDPCDPYRPLVHQTMMRSCQLVPNECLYREINQAIRDSSWPEVEDQLGRTELYVTETGFSGPGKSADGKTITTFVPAFPVTPGQSILLRQEVGYGLPYFPGCLFLQLRFNDGVADDNYAGITVKIWVGPKNAGITSQGDLFDWNDKQVLFGAKFRCGDKCSEVSIPGPSGCANADMVGKLSTLYIQIDNKTGNSNNITMQQIAIKFANIVEACCNSCSIGGSCGCK